jgi:hypothetical protein
MILAIGRGENTILVLLLIAFLVTLFAHKCCFNFVIFAYMEGLIIRR